MELPTNFLLFYFVREGKTLFLNAFNCEGIKPRDLLVWNLFKILKNSVSSKLLLLSFHGIQWLLQKYDYRIHCTNIQLFYKLQISLFVCLFECWVTDSLSSKSDKKFWCTLSIMTHNTCCFKKLLFCKELCFSIGAYNV